MYVIVQVIADCSIGHKKNSIHYPVEQFLLQLEGSKSSRHTDIIRQQVP